MSYLTEVTEAHIEMYFEDEDTPPSDIYSRVMSHVWPGLLVATLNRTEGNKTQAAKILGINRGTLNSKIKEFGVKYDARTVQESVFTGLPRTTIKTTGGAVEFVASGEQGYFKEQQIG